MTVRSWRWNGRVAVRIVPPALTPTTERLRQRRRRRAHPQNAHSSPPWSAPPARRCRSVPHRPRRAPAGRRPGLDGPAAAAAEGATGRAEQLPDHRAGRHRADAPDVRPHPRLRLRRQQRPRRDQPGYTFEVTKGTPTSVTYVNALPARHLFDNEVPDYMHAGSPVRMNTHLHGGHVAGASDGNPYAYPAEYLPGTGRRASSTPTSRTRPCSGTTTTPTRSRGSTCTPASPGSTWSATRVDTGPEPNGLGVPGGAYEIPLVLADRQFDASGQLFYSPDSTWLPEFFGDTPLVNGAVQPYLAVEPRIYRFRILNASNARFWNLTIQGGPPVVQIGSDGGLFDRPGADQPAAAAPGRAGGRPRRLLPLRRPDADRHQPRPARRRLQPGPAARRRSWRSGSAGGSPVAGPGQVPGHAARQRCRRSAPRR